MRHYIYLLILTLFFATFFSCSQESRYKDGTLISFADFEETQDLIGTTVPFGDAIMKPTRLWIQDRLLITINTQEEKLFHLLDLKSKSKIGERVSVGQGPDEMLQPCFVKSNSDNICFFDMVTQTLFEYKMNEFCNSENPKPISKIKLGEKIFGEIRLLGNDIVGSTYNPAYQFLKFDETGKKTGATGEYPVSDISFTDKEKIEAYRFTFTSNAIDKMVLCYSWTDLIEIYNKEGNLEKRIHGPQYFISNFKEFHDGNVVSSRSVKGQYRDAYYNPVSVGDDFFVLFSGKSEDEEGYSILANQIFVFNWDGTPKKILRLDQGVFTFAVDKENKKIYGISDEPDFHIVEFSYN